jgi:predicted component of type VI protein secretion system
MSILSKFRQDKQKSHFRENIFEHLCDLLNTKRGYGSYPKDLGHDSYIYLGSDRKIVLQIIQDVKNCFEKYEKRISHVEVIPKTSAGSFFLSFIIKCKIESKACSFSLCFQRQNKFYSIEVEE